MKRFLSAIRPWIDWLGSVPHRTGLLNSLRIALAAIGVWAARNADDWRWLVGAVLAAIALVLVDVAQRWAEQADLVEAEKDQLSALAKYQEIVGAVLSPLAAAVAQIAAEPSRPKRLEQLGATRARIVEAAVQLVPGATRSAYYKLNEAKDGLVRRSDGPPDSPRTEFAPGLPDTKVVLDLVLGGKAVLISDVRTDPAVVPSPGSSYRSVIAVAVTAGSERYGMLTVDAPEPDALTERDLTLMRAFASHLGAAIAAFVRP